MYDDILLKDNKIDDTSTINNTNLDELFNNLTSDIETVNKFISNLNNQKTANNKEEQVLIEERQKIDRDKEEFEKYMAIQREEINQKKNQVEQYLNNQKEYLAKAESDFKTNMDNSLSELELAKKELEIQKEKIKEEKEQFENYKSLEINRIHHAEEILASERNQFERYKEITNEKLELESKNFEQKCIKFKEIISQFNSNFKPITEDINE